MYNNWIFKTIDGFKSRLDIAKTELVNSKVISLKKSRIKYRKTKKSSEDKRHIEMERMINV